MYNPNDFNIDSFSVALGDSESGTGTGTGAEYDYSVVNDIGAIGKYQFMPTTITDIAQRHNLTRPSNYEFQNSPDIQEQYFKLYVSDILNWINDYNLDSYIGQIKTGQGNNITYPIDIYGLVAASWLGGIGHLINYLQSGKDYNDGRTYISDYLTKFSSFQLGKKKI